MASSAPMVAPLEELAQLRGDGPPSIVMQSLYYPVLARHKGCVNPPYVCPAVRVTPGRRGGDCAIFPLSAFELGEVWEDADELDMWELEPVDGGWERVELEFLPRITYPMQLLHALLEVLRRQRYANDTDLDGIPGQQHVDGRQG